MEAVRREDEKKLGSEALERGGLRIYTTLDPALQQAAVSSVGKPWTGPATPPAPSRASSLRTGR